MLMKQFLIFLIDFLYPMLHFPQRLFSTLFKFLLLRIRETKQSSKHNVISWIWKFRRSIYRIRRRRDLTGRRRLIGCWLLYWSLLSS
jgi:hypothetical protein